jgi:hypothetical protein
MPKNERPTVAPPFDPQAYARESESKLRHAAAVPNSEVRRAAAPRPSRRSVPYVAVSMSALKSRALDHRQGFLVSLVDGTSTVEDLLDLSGMPEDEALGIVGDLVSVGILALR